ncbi:MAG: metal-dependent hydrolase [Desulfobulbaceae bacterium A2]|nr:MAG: metal-dependent hydrolase [Desulfobulbaceae bacterium A2]
MSAGCFTHGKECIRFKVLHVVRKTLAIEVLPDSSVVVKAPVGTELEEVHRRVIRRARWIITQQQYFRQFEPRTPVRQFVGGETHLYLGRQYRLRVGEGGKDSVKLSRGYFIVTTANPGRPETIRQLLDKWYLAKATATFHGSFARCWPYFAKLGLAHPRMQIRRMKKRWGSLSRGGLLTLNTDLIRAPKECIDYVITHELCHLRCHDHGPEYYQLLEKVMPDWAKRKHRLELALA